MSKKHFTELARIISRNIERTRRDSWRKSPTSEAWRVASESIGMDLADWLDKESPEFNRSRFLKACGIV